MSTDSRTAPFILAWAGRGLVCHSRNDCCFAFCSVKNNSFFFFFTAMVCPCACVDHQVIHKYTWGYTHIYQPSLKVFPHIHNAQINEEWHRLRCNYVDAYISTCIYPHKCMVMGVHMYLNVTACNVLPLLEVILVCLQFGLSRVPGRFFAGVQGHLHLWLWAFVQEWFSLEKWNKEDILFSVGTWLLVFLIHVHVQQRVPETQQILPRTRNWSWRRGMEGTGKKK